MSEMHFKILLLIILSELFIRFGLNNSSSEMSNSNSSSAKTSIIDSFIFFSFFERAPDNILLFISAALIDCDPISFETDYAWIKSSLPFKKARFVNSPGSAKWQFFILDIANCIALMTALLPWTWNSAKFSPV